MQKSKNKRNAHIFYVVYLYVIGNKYTHYMHQGSVEAILNLWLNEIHRLNKNINFELYLWRGQTKDT